MHRILFDSEGVLRVPVVIALFVLVPAAVLALASWGGWPGIAGIGLIVVVGLVTMIRAG